MHSTVKQKSVVYSIDDLKVLLAPAFETYSVKGGYLFGSYSRGEARADMIESDAVGFFAIDNLPDNISPPCVPALNKYRDSKCTV